MIRYTPYLVTVTTCLFVALSEVPADDVTFFENRIRPVLVKHCYKCHSNDSKEVGGKLLLDSREGVLKGGEAGAAIVPGDAEKSLLMQALRYDGLEMPPEAPLPESVINDFAQWIREGAVDPRTTQPAESNKDHISNEALWAFQPLQNPVVPAIKSTSWPRSEIDRFILRQVEAANLEPARDADARTLIRRLYVDLIGLAPTYEQIESFATASDKDRETATANLVDELLGSPQFGERWGRHWLDVARYAECNGNDGLSRNHTFPHAWRYRDYVIAAFNDDTPYNRFITEQIAGDLLPAENDEERDKNLVATGFLAMAAKPAKAMNNNFAMDVVADQIDVVGRGIMGISVACARCHDHKFDPVPTREYYALAGIFTSTETMWGTAANEGLTAPPTDLHVLKAAEKVPPPKGWKETVFVLESNTGKPKPVPKSKWPVGTPLAMGVRDSKKPTDCKINIKGDAKKLGEAIPRGFLAACQLESGSEIAVNSKQSGRLQLAEWLTRPDHPLTARVMANRIWHHLFGQGIVRTPDDFGVYGERPTHPQLLDHLAKSFIDDGWSIKRLVRRIVLSRTYQLASDADERLLQADEGNRLLARHSRRRLDAESIRDRMLQASGQLDLTPGDGSLVRHRNILVNLAGNLHQPSNHRSIYLCYLRNSPPPELSAFDLPEFTTVTGRRNVSTVPNQALHLFNTPFVVRQAEHLAKRVTETNKSNDESIRLLWQHALGRIPTSDEFAQASILLRQSEYELLSKQKAWVSVAQALLLTNEFRYVD